MEDSAMLLGVSSTVWGFIALTSGYCLLGIGIPKQIYDNYKAKSCSDSKLPQILLGFVYLSLDAVRNLASQQDYYMGERARLRGLLVPVLPVLDIWE
jgi:hypothetical protein